MSVDVQLAIPEFVVAVQSALTRMLVSAGQQINHATTYRRTTLTRLQEETIGCCAELAIAKLFDRYTIPTVGTFHVKPDFLHDVEIRGTGHESGRLIVRDNDASERRYVLATVSGIAGEQTTTVTFHGWMYGYEAKQARWLTNPNNYRSAWFVPQSELRPFETLVEELVAPLAAD